MILRILRHLTVFILLGSTAGSAESKIRILSWNIHHGEGTDGKIDLQRIATVIQKARPDLVALQEVDQKTHRSGQVDQTAELSQLTGLVGIFGKAMDFSGGAYGQAILSKHPVISNKVHRLPGNNEPRIAFESIVSIHRFNLKFISTHLDVSPIPRLAQAKALVSLFPKQKLPIILCGDFNDGPESETLRQFRDWQLIPKQAPPFTHPATHPTTEIDYIFTLSEDPLPTNPTTISIIPEAIASDHRPLLVEFVIHPGPP